MPTLTDMTEAAETRWPDLGYRDGGSRAQAAADLVAEGHVIALAAAENGADRWGVNGYVCSFQDRCCECGDRAPVDAQLGKLCKHRLAVMFQMRIRREQETILPRIFTRASETVRLEVRTTFAGDLHKQQNRLRGYRVDNETWTRFPQREDETPFTMREFEDAAYAGGWVVRSRVNQGRHMGGVELWELAPMAVQAPPIETATDSGKLYGWDAEDARRARQDREFERQLKETR